MPAHAALTTYIYFLSSIPTPLMQKVPSLHCYRGMRWAKVVLCTGFAICAQARQPSTPYRVHLRLGLLLRSRLFSTQPRGHAVTLRFTSGSRFGGDQICTDWIVYSHGHTRRCVLAPHERFKALAHTMQVRTGMVPRYLSIPICLIRL